MRIVSMAALLTVAACTQGVLTPLPPGDGYGPAGGGFVDAGKVGTGSSGDPPPTAPTGSPPSTGDDAGATAEAGPAPVDAGSEASDSGYVVPTEGGAPDAPVSSGDGAVSADLLAECVSQINSLRAQNGVYLYTESTQLESYAALATASDAHNDQRHSYFYATGGGGGVAATEDELDGDQVAPGASAEATMLTGLQQDVQAQGQALANLVSQQLSEVGCGFAQDAAGNWWVDIALR